MLFQLTWAIQINRMSRGDECKGPKGGKLLSFLLLADIHILIKVEHLLLLEGQYNNAFKRSRDVEKEISNNDINTDNSACFSVQL